VWAAADRTGYGPGGAAAILDMKPTMLTSRLKKIKLGKALLHLQLRGARGAMSHSLLSSLTLPTRVVVEGILLVCLLGSAWVFTPANSHVEAQPWSEPLNCDRFLSRGA
jgi:hypothetical protein